jgi:heterodisulfide reductase subunit A
VQASGAAGQAGAMLASARNTMVTPKPYPPERDVVGEPPRIGVFVCHCGINIGGVVDVPSVKEYAATLPGVAFAEENMYTCSQDTQEKIREQIIENGLNRVVVASCSPRTHEPLFQETMRDAGLNPHLFSMANIRDQCSWVHQSEKEAATEKSKDLVRMAVAQARLLKPLHSVELPVTQKCLVVGGGVAGMTAALAVSEQGYDVFLVEREEQLGGNLRRVYTTIDGQDVQKRLADMIARIEADPRIAVYTQTTVADINGYVGNYKANLNGANGEGGDEIEFGTVILATGGKEYQPTEYLYGRHDDVVTQLEFEKELVDQPDTAPENIVMIQCVGSREEGRQYCSRVCCATAIKNALRAKRQNPDANVYILYRDIRTYGLYEKYYRQAREAGVVFVEFDPTDPPVAEPENGHLKVTVLDQVLNQRVELPAHRLVLSAGVVPEHTNEELAMMLKVPINADGFFLEAHVKLRPVDFATEGVFMAGLAHAPKNITEVIGQANAAAARATTVLVHDKRQSTGKTAQVNTAACSGCGLCELVCAFGAIAVNPELRVAEVNEGLCKGCGACAASCRAGAVDLGGFANDQLLAAVEGALF